ncbi:MAG: minor capsid protein [Coriobacteriia bacterium]|nr:minor capsid protein [Coriobacteriia bacterium]
MPTDTYWIRRAARRVNASERYSEAQLTRLFRTYDQAYRDIDRMIEEVYSGYSSQTGLDRQQLQRLLSLSATDRFWRTLEGRGMQQYVMENYRSRINRLEQLQAQLYTRVAELARREQAINAETYSEILKHGYASTIADYTGDIPFYQLDNQTINRLLREPWSGADYSERIWGNTEHLAERLDDILTRGAMTGASYERMSRELRETFKVSKSNADRLIRTEANHFHNEAEYQAYRDMGVEQYTFMATLDARTSDICQEHDGKHYRLDEREQGVNWPPLHPNCRSTVIAYLGDEWAPTVRRVRNPVTGESEVVPWQSYEEWAARNLVAGDTTKSTKESRLFTDREMAGGYRTPAHTTLDHDAIERLKQEAISIGIPQDILSFNTGSQTGYSEELRLIHVRGDVLPDMSSNLNRDTMTSRAVLAHEYYGHLMHHGSKAQYIPGFWRDEYRASATASVRAPGLTEEERRSLMIDAYERAQEAGYVLSLSRKARKMIYGR